MHGHDEDGRGVSAASSCFSVDLADDEAYP